MKIKCRICDSEYHSVNRPPRVLGRCGHSFCSECLSSMINATKSRFKDFQNWMLRCPFDKKEHLIKRDTSVEEFPINYELVEVLRDLFERKSSRSFSARSDINVSNLETAKKLSFEDDQPVQNLAIKIPQPTADIPLFSPKDPSPDPNPSPPEPSHTISPPRQASPPIPEPKLSLIQEEPRESVSFVRSSIASQNSSEIRRDSASQFCNYDWQSNSPLLPAKASTLFFNSLVKPSPLGVEVMKGKKESFEGQESGSVAREGSEKGGVAFGPLDLNAPGGSPHLVGCKVPKMVQEVFRLGEGKGSLQKKNKENEGSVQKLSVPPDFLVKSHVPGAPEVLNKQVLSGMFSPPVFLEQKLSKLEKQREVLGNAANWQQKAISLKKLPEFNLVQSNLFSQK